MLYPFRFVPRLKDRIWGGRRLADLFGRPISGSSPVGESWEVSDRPGDESIVAEGPLAGKTLRWLVENCGAEMFGRPVKPDERFPWLAKILDAKDDLSLQVHPPSEIASQLQGEPKTEIWYVASALPGAVLYAGLNRGVTREEFERRTADGTVAECFHRVPVKSGDVMFLPSGRVHALGAGIVLFEIQQNSDTTYRVFDWNRVGLDGKARELHIPQSLASIDFDDFEPALIETAFQPLAPGVTTRPLVSHEAFKISLRHFKAGAQIVFPRGRMYLVACVEGACRAFSPLASTDLPWGAFALLPASIESTVVAACESQMIVVEEPNDD